MENKEKTILVYEEQLMARSHEYKKYLREILQDPDLAEEYLNAALEDGNPEVFLLALRNVFEASPDPNKRNFETVYNTFSENVNPEFIGIETILVSLGYDLAAKRQLKK